MLPARLGLAPRPTTEFFPAKAAYGHPSLRRCEKIDLGTLFVIPSGAGIQYFQALENFLDPGFHRGDDQRLISSHLLNGYLSGPFRIDFSPPILYT